MNRNSSKIQCCLSVHSFGDCFYNKRQILKNNMHQNFKSDSLESKEEIVRSSYKATMFPEEHG